MSKPDPVLDAWNEARRATEDHPLSFAQAAVAAFNGLVGLNERQRTHLTTSRCRECEDALTRAWDARCPPDSLYEQIRQWPTTSALRAALERHVAGCGSAHCSAFAATMAAGPAPRARKRFSLADLRMVLVPPRLVLAPSPHRRATEEVMCNFADSNGHTVARIRGKPGAATTQLTVFFDDAQVGDGPVIVALALAPDEILAWHEFRVPSGKGEAELDIEPEAAGAEGAVVLFARPATTGHQSEAGETSSGGAFWELWGPGDAMAMATLARYASAAALAGVGLNIPTHELRSGPTDEDDDRRVAHALYERLRTRGIAYALEPYVPPAPSRQQIRDPEWVVRDRIGTCADLALTYASMCLDAKVAPLIAVTRDHMFVLLWLGRLILDRAHPTPPGCTTEGAGTFRLENPDALLRAIPSELISIECTGATSSRDLSFDDSQATARALIKEGTRLVDVVVAHRHGYSPLPRPTRRPPIMPYIPRGQRPKRLYGSQARALERLEGLSGLVVVLAPQGQGKSTIARELVHRAQYGAGWFLDASERRRLTESLADAELQHHNVTATSLTAVSRDEHAQSALARLGLAEDPWTVVLDNADGPPSGIASLLPAATRAGQQVVVTTTNPEWRAVKSAQVVELDPMDDQDVLAEIPHHELLPLINGRALMVDAVGRYLLAGGDPRRIIASAPASDDELRPDVAGPLALYRAVVSEHPAGKTLRHEARLAALLPPDHLSVPLLTALAEDNARWVTALLDGGILAADQGSARARIHRLLIAAVQHDEDALMPSTAVDLAGSHEACDVLDRWADAATVLDFTDRLLQADAEDEDAPPDRELGLRLYRVAAVLETKGHTKQSSELYKRAQRHLDENRDDDRELMAGCWHGIARFEYQQNPGDRPRLEEALTLARQAERTLSDLRGPSAAGRHLAMVGLIEKAIALTAPTRHEKATGLNDALTTLEEADRRRREGTADEAELLRSRYNLAGIRIDLAKLDREHAARLLSEAKGIYEEVGQRREALYGRPLHPHIAACHHGRGIVGFYQALLIPQQSRAQHVMLLRDACNAVWKGLVDRQTLGGSEDTADVRKSLDLLARLAAYRVRLSMNTDDRVQPTEPDIEAEMEELLTKLLIELEDASLHT